MWGTYKTDAKPTPSAAEQAEKRLARIETYLAGAFVDAIAETRELFTLAELERLIVNSSLSPEMMKAAPPAPGWHETAFSRLALLGRPAVAVWVDPARFLVRWRPVRNLGAPPSPQMAAAMARDAAAGVMMAPPVFARLPGDRWAFLEGRERFLYAVSADAESAPLVIPADDLAAFKKAFKGVMSFGVPPAPMPGGLEPPLGEAAGQPSHIAEAVDQMAFAAGNSFGSAVIAAASAAGEIEAKRIAAMVEKRHARKLDISVNLGGVNVNALHELQLSTLNLIREFSLEQREAVLAVLRDGVARGLNPNDLARQLRASIGLTAHQAGIVSNYRRALERAHQDAGAAANALGRALRDGRYDRTVAAALRNTAPLTAQQIDAMVARYQERWIAYRARTIARTQALRAAHMGELAAWQAAFESGDVNPNEVIQTWETARDDRVRHSHTTLQGQQQPYGVPFKTPGGSQLRFPGDPEASPSETINCRCILTRQITEQPIKPEEQQAPTDDRMALESRSGYEATARESRPTGYSGDGIVTPGRMFGSNPADPIDTRFRIGSDVSTALDALSASEIQALIANYERQLATKLSRDMTGYLSSLAKDIPKGAKAVGKTIAMKEGASLSLNAREAIRTSGTVLRVNMGVGQPVLFTGAAGQTITLPPGTRFVIRSIEKVSQEEYLRRFGGSGSFSIRGKAGISVVSVDIVPGSGVSTVSDFLAVLRAELATRETGIAAIEAEIAANNKAKPLLAEPKPSVAYAPQKGGEAWNAYLAKMPGANDTARQALSSLTPINVVVDGSPHYQSGIVGKLGRQIGVNELSPRGQAAKLIFQHELGHYVDHLGGKSLFGSAYWSAGLADDIESVYQAWRKVIETAPGVPLGNRREVARYLSKQFGIPVEEIVAGEVPIIDRYLSSVVTRFTRETGFNPAKIVGDNIGLQAEFASAMKDGNIARLTRVIGESHLHRRSLTWDERDALSHMVYDLIGSVTRLEYGGGHSPEYYLRGRLLKRNLPNGYKVGDYRQTVLTEDNTTEAFANWFALYTSGPGERGLLRMLIPDLNAKFEAYLSTFGRGFLGGLLG